MARKKIKSATDQRPFIMVYHDFLESNILDTYEKMVFIALKKFTDSNNQCFPSLNKLSGITGISKRKIQDVLISLEQKQVISVHNRTRSDGGKTSNLYTLYDFKELWNAESSEDVAAVVDEYEDKKLISLLEAKGYKIVKEKELESEPTKAQNQALTQSNILQNNNTITKEKSQEYERYTMAQIKEIFEYDYILLDYLKYKSEVDTVIQILYDVMNTSKPTIRISGEDKPSMVVIGKLMKLDKESIIYAIEKYQEHIGVVTHPINYMLAILYKAPEQFELEIRNRINSSQY